MSAIDRTNQARLERRVKALEELVNTLDREAEITERHVEYLDRTVSHFRSVISTLYRAIWPRKTLEGPLSRGRVWTQADEAAFSYQLLWPEPLVVDGREVSRQAPARPFPPGPKRRWPLYGPLEALRSQARQHNVRRDAATRWPRDLVVEALLEAGVDVARQDALR